MKRESGCYHFTNGALTPMQAMGQLVVTPVAIRSDGSLTLNDFLAIENFEIPRNQQQQKFQTL
jgi:hypothetical protein